MKSQPACDNDKITAVKDKDAASQRWNLQQNWNLVKGVMLGVFVSSKISLFMAALLTKIVKNQAGKGHALHTGP